MNNRDRIHVDRIKEELLLITRTLEDKDIDIFLHDDILQHAVSMSLITIGECANHLSADFRERHSQTQWIEVIAIRNIAAHGYWQLNMELIWQAVEEDIPKLKQFFDSIE